MERFFGKSDGNILHHLLIFVFPSISVKQNQARVIIYGSFQLNALRTRLAHIPATAA